MGYIVCPGTSARNYHYTLRNFPEERRSRLLSGESLKSLKSDFVHIMNGVTQIRNKVYWTLFITLFNTFTKFKTRRIQWINIDSYNNKNAQTWLWFLLNLSKKFPNYTSFCTSHQTYVQNSLPFNLPNVNYVKKTYLCRYSNQVIFLAEHIPFC